MSQLNTVLVYNVNFTPTLSQCINFSEIANILLETSDCTIRVDSRTKIIITNHPCENML